MLLLEHVTRLLSRFRYPVSLPEDVAQDLGLPLSNTLPFYRFLQLLESSQYRPTRLRKYMSREFAEAVFESALKKETFRSSSLFSYYFNKGWLVFTLYFDHTSRLSRLSVQCPACEQFDDFEISLSEEPAYAAASSH